MLKSRLALETELNSYFSKNLNNTDRLKESVNSLQEIYKIPKQISSDYLVMRKDLTEADPFTLFALASEFLPAIELDKYYTKAEIASFGSSTWEESKIKFPLKFDMTKITDEQYIGHITTTKLMQFKDAQLINYNENVQRTMKHIIRGTLEYYQIALNKEAVNAIMNSYEGDIYIPNTITLNLPEDADFYYDEKKKQLIIEKADHLDILDGYHRYIAISKMRTKYPDFNYDMELRIVHFSEDKAKRFTWQEDQKTKMRRVDSESMDSVRVSNKIVERMNSDSAFIFSGRISRNKGIINAAYLSNIIDMLFIKDLKKSEEPKAVKQVSTQLIEAMEKFTDICPEYLEKPWPKLLIYTLCYEVLYGDIKNTEKDAEKVQEDGSIYQMSKLKKADITRTHKLLGKKGY